ncbi:MAG TPA: carbohydrate ABC transporter permease [Actinomycetota bacterium]|nr:carbohydrate ABC transporter permease [Actinomycetota bacterium]
MTRPGHTWLWRLAILGVSLLFLAPLAFMVAGSLRQPGLPPPDGFELVPDPVHPRNYRDVTLFVPMWTYVRNSAFVVAVAVPLTVLVASWAGFAIATARPRVRRFLIALSVVCLMVPVSALWVPRFVMFEWAGILDTFVPLVLPALMATSPFYVLLFALVYARIPRELFEAAALERLSPLATWRKVAWPLARPAAFAVAMLAFVFHWSNFVDPLLYLSEQSLYTVPLGLRSLHALEPTLHPVLLAASVVVTLPGVIAFLLAQKTFLSKTV